MKQIGWNIEVAGEGQLRHKRHGWMQAVRRGDRGKNLVFETTCQTFLFPSAMRNSN